MPGSRRSFLSILGLGALGSALDPNTLRAESVASGGLKPVDDTWDLSWTKRVNGKYRAVFDVQAIIGDPVFRASMWREQYAKVFGIEPSKLSAVVVIRHQGIAQVMDDEFWKEFPPGRSGGRGSAPADSAAPRESTTGNPGSAPIAAFIKSGGVVLACNMAFGTLVSRYTAKAGSADAARKMAVSHLIPGVILQPSGPFALMRAQDEGCNYMMAS